MSEREKPKKNRVTLTFRASRLALPGEEDSVPAPLELADSTELALPEPDEDDAPVARSAGGERRARSGSADSIGLGDAWDRERDRESVEPQPIRRAPRSEPPSPVEDAADAIALVDVRSRPSSKLDLLTEMHDRFALGDYTSALYAAELILGRNSEHEAAKKVSAACYERLAALHGSRLGSLERVPVVLIDPSDVRWLGLDHRSGFVLSRIDGEHSVDELIDISGMPRLEVLKTFVELLDAGAIGFADG